MDKIKDTEDLVVSDTATHPQEIPFHSPQGLSRRKAIRLTKDTKTAIALSILAVMVAACFWLSRDIVSIGAKTLKSTYESSYNSEKERVYNSILERYRKAAEEKYRVSNDVSIHVESLREISRLRVLEVTDTEYVVDNRGDNDGNIVAWLKVSGKANFVVDLQMAEFVIDSDRQHVLVKTQYPFLADEIEITGEKPLLFKDDAFNGNYRQGDELREKQRREAMLLMEKEFVSNQRFYQSARDAAISSIECLVKQLNPNVPDLVVEVEFY